MTPFVEQKRTTQEQQEQRQDRGFEHVAAPALSEAFEKATFGPGPESVKILFRAFPRLFEGMSIPDGTNFPSPKNLLVNELIAQQMKLHKAA